jgi:hypothetical protein
MATWHTVESARDQWVDAPTDEGADPDATLSELLETAKQAVRAYAPVLPDEGGLVIDEDGYIVNAASGEIPDSYRVAQLMETQNLWNKGKSPGAGDFDNGAYGIPATFLAWHGVVRPKQGIPVIA